MTPSSSSHDIVYGLKVDIELPRYGDVVAASLPAQGSDCQNLGLGQLGVPLLFAQRPSAFSYHIGKVLGLGSLKQMGRIAARRPVASVANMKSRPDACSEKQGYAMSVKHSRLKVSLLLKASISADKVTSPLPALALRAVAGGLVNLFPEAFELLRGELGRVYSDVSHFNLLNRLIRLGSFDCSSSPAGRLYFSMEAA